MHWLWWVQIAADVLLIGAVVLLLARLRGGGGAAAGGGEGPDLAGFMSEAQRLAGDFDRLLAEKRELVSTTLTGLDRRIERMRAMAEELNRPAPAPEPEPLAESEMAGFRRQVVELASAGKSAAEIAAATGRPRGEVELVLSLAAKGK